MKIQDLVVNYELQPVKSNPEGTDTWKEKDPSSLCAQKFH